jgi:hypothetical protein
MRGSCENFELDLVVTWPENTEAAKLVDDLTILFLIMATSAMMIST